ncbi:hypothetical protein J6590_037721, partial [Homalodisca vitripennis]
NKDTAITKEDEHFSSINIKRITVKFILMVSFDRIDVGHNEFLPQGDGLARLTLHNKLCLEPQPALSHKAKYPNEEFQQKAQAVSTHILLWTKQRLVSAKLIKQAY